MNFSELMRAVRGNPNDVVVPSHWGQGRAGFGGLAAALVYEAMRAKVPAGRPVRSLAITFVGPLAVDTPVSFEVEVLREGKAVSQVLGRAVQDGQVVTLVQGSFGGARESAIKVEAELAPAMKPAEEAMELPYVKGVTPEFTQHLAMRWAVGGMPFTNTPKRQMGGWVRFRTETEARPVDEADLLALVDAWPPAVLPHLRQKAPGSSLTWTIEFVQPAPTLSTLDWCQYLAEIDHAQDGYGHVAAKLRTPSGELVAISRQTVAVFG
ncbi:thioesterase family protein [Pseudomonas cavernae]|uniref:Thioesterase family protein n=1 Tax=Pseudomonas cavernae TaxID=2320867 RepID=A0A385Z580_9PSED|nr:thioesterase family protein [Pseudomonas cavernae]AYC32662.1 thioesterase family protein [Pseudomonas cavernae]